MLSLKRSVPQKKQQKENVQLASTTSPQLISPMARLSNLAERVSTVHTDQEKMTSKRKSDDEERMRALKEDVLYLQKELDNEINRRKDAGNALQAQIDERAIATQESFSQNTKDRMTLVVPSLDKITDRFSPLENDSLSKDLQIKRLEEQSVLIDQQLKAFIKSFSEETTRRTNAEQDLSIKIQETEKDLQNQFNNICSVLKSEIEATTSQKKECEDKENNSRTDLEEKISYEAKRLEEGIELEKKLREDNEEQIIATVEKVFGTFQDGLTKFDE
ncbi:putative SF-assemblin/beta giardin [Monocercomonoides exilis]|uniref:putative SF-assemblin/beta giardin n=1 Tax=Monocercomonoides exilis TaxID=2049356 RepID=UPI003559CF21|nr:putative SF-assemblin/beta giardin [Monocercomonoides exilis]|eukprot:MONOS_16005.1-p1 / transcript=MONOS_16005.1 / gene=MONOS_16005 / organism=Monocercomonoides_exilis_PA203 / gene_product=unspecified product / transcript_product=unspecified product / location=Mono_scaffold01455:3777-4874(+) / protein_length=274 / sequence_SO=supercontig / SO=protein_coding / is_pseudo=false